MKLANWSLHFFRLPYVKPVTWAYGSEDSGDYALLKLSADNGAVGIGEGVIKPARSGYSPRSLAATLEDVILPLLKDVDLGDDKALGKAFGWIEGNLNARALVDNAVWSLRAAAKGTPLWREWGGRQEVPVAWIVTRQKPADMGREAADMVSRYGLRSLKVKGGQGLETDLRAIAEVRAAVGPKVELSMDANRHYPQEGIGKYVRAIADAGVTVAEDPCHIAPDAAFEKVQRECPIPLLVDFACTSLQDAALFIERGARALMIKPARIGLSEARQIDALCAKHGVSVSYGMYYETALGSVTSLAGASAIKSKLVLPSEQCFFLRFTSQVTSAPLTIKDGAFRLPDEADLDQLIDWKAVEKHKL